MTEKEAREALWAAEEALRVASVAEDEARRTVRLAEAALYEAKAALIRAQAQELGVDVRIGDE